MAMTIMNNTGAMLTLGQLNKNISKVGKELKKASSGMKLNSAGDDASGYSISEKMRVRIRGLEQDEQNVKNGKALLHVAEGGIQSIVDEIRTLKELALNSANDHNTDFDRATIQKEFDSRKANIDDIASETNYNGKFLLDGRYGKRKVPNITMNEPAGSPQTVSGTTISADGVYVIPTGFSGTITIASGVNNVEIRQANPGAQLNDVYIQGPAGGGANIWINNLNINNTQDGSIIKFQGSNNYLTLIGDNTITYTGTIDYNKAVINMGDGLTLEGTGSLNIRNTGDMSCAGIGVDQDQYTSGSLTINSGTYDIFVNNDGACIGTSVRGRIGDIIINGGTIKTVAATGAGIGSTGCVLSAVTSPYQNSLNQVGNIVIGKEAVIDAQSMYGTGIGSGANHAHAASIKISRYADIKAKSTYGEDIGRGLYGTVGDIITDWVDGDINYTGYRWGDGKPLVIHHGTKANEAVNIFINDMHTKALSLDKVNVRNQQEATATLRVIDNALNYALGEMTNIGAYISRLDFTEANIVTANESTQASESTIRDADMAKVMTEYTKSNVLAQASQSMLAQANQTSASVLSLLQ